MKNKLLSVFILASVMTLTSLMVEPKFSYKTYGNVANYFEDEYDMRTFFDFHKGDVVAEIGAFDGANMCGFSLLADSVMFYVQDIDSTSLTQTKFDKIIKRNSKYRTSTTNQFQLCFGTVTQTNLPDNSFDKIILSATFHEFTFIEEMMTDIYNKLKPSGQLYILESHCGAETHKNYSAEETIGMLQKYHFSLVKKDGKDLNGSTGLYRLVFRKNL